MTPLTAEKHCSARDPTTRLTFFTAFHGFSRSTVRLKPFQRSAFALLLTKYLNIDIYICREGFCFFIHVVYRDVFFFRDSVIP